MIASSRPNQSGQAAAELAAVLPVFVLFLVLFFEIGLVLVDQLAVMQVAREGARAAAVNASTDAARSTAIGSTDLEADRLQVDFGPRPDADGMIRVTARYRSRIIEPFTGKTLFEPQLRSEVSMRVETPETTDLSG